MPLVQGLLESSDLQEGEEKDLLERGILIGVAYAANVGGIATIIGTLPNAIFALLLSETFPGSPDVGFATWFGFAFPISFTMLLATWLVVYIVFIRHVNVTLSRESLDREYKKLGPISRDEFFVGMVLLLLVLLWIIRPQLMEDNIGFCTQGETLLDSVDTKGECLDIGGTVWSAYIDDGTIACLGASILFFIPSRKRPSEKILDGRAFNTLPWGVLLILGAGFAIANAFSVSGLSQLIGEGISSFTSLSDYGLVFMITTIVCYVTEVVSNSATSTIFLPIIFAVAVQNEINPLLLALPATVATSLAFMLPIATPPNLTIFATGKVSFWDMIKAGFFLNILGILVVSSMSFGTVRVIDPNIETFPSWANVTL